jgi:hypothetical protein
MSRMGLVSPSHYGTRASHIPTSLLRLVLLKFSPWVSGLVFPTISVSRGSCSPISSCLPFGFPLGARVPHFASLRIWDSCIPFFPSTFGARDPRFGFYCSPMELVFSNCLILNFFITATAFAFLGLVFPAVGSRKIHFPAFDAQPFCTFTFSLGLSFGFVFIRYPRSHFISASTPSVARLVPVQRIVVTTIPLVFRSAYVF